VVEVHLSNRSVQRITWRRDKVREYSIKGYTQRDIAAELQISLGLVEKELSYLRMNSKENIRKYIDEYLPAEYENCLAGLNNIMKEAWQMSLEGEKRERMLALALAKDCYQMKLELLSSATVVERAVNFVNRHRGLTVQNKEVVKDDSAEPIKYWISTKNN
jgi:hypothetical protein